MTGQPGIRFGQKIGGMRVLAGMAVMEGFWELTGLPQAGPIATINFMDYSSFMVRFRMPCAREHQARRTMDMP